LIFLALLYQDISSLVTMKKCLVVFEMGLKPMRKKVNSKKKEQIFFNQYLTL